MKKSSFYLIILLFSTIFTLSCKNTIKNKKYNKNISISENQDYNNNTKENIKSINESILVDTDTLKLPCNLKVVRMIDENINNLTKNDIQFFLMTFHKKCNNNVEYLEYSNEVLFAILNNYPKEVIEIMKENKKLDKETIFNTLSSPVNDKIDILELKNKLKILNDSLANKIIKILP